MSKNTLVKSISDWIITPGFSEKSNLIESLQSTWLRLIFMPTLSLVKHISSNEVINPPDEISWPDIILSSIIKSCIKLTGYVNSTDDFKDQPKVINGASDIIAKIFDKKGEHTRAAVSVNSLPLGVAVEVDAIFELI